MSQILTAAAFSLATLFGAAATAQEASAVQEMTLGDPAAPVTVIEYASFTCPHCKNFHDTSFDRLKADYIDTGKIHFIYREVYFDRPGLWAAMVARCGGPDRYFGIADMIYEKQSEWVQGGEPVQIADNLRRIGRSAGIGDEQLDACLQDADMAQALVADYQRNIEADGVDSTPSFVIGGETYTNRPYEDLAKLIDDQIGG